MADALTQNERPAASSITHGDQEMPQEFTVMPSTGTAVIITQKPPPGPMKRKKKLDKSLIDLSCNPKQEEKRQRIADDTKAGGATKKPTEVVVAKPPPTTAKEGVTTRSSSNNSSTKAKELQNHTLFKLKRKNEETNAALVQKLNACTEQLRQEVQQLKTALVSEKNAVRALRAQHEAVARKIKLEAKQTIKGGAVKQKLPVETNPVVVGGELPSSQKNATKLVHEIAVLKDQNKSLEGKVQACTTADKLKTSDIREIKEAHDARLTQVTKSAKLEINRLLEEIKAKDKTIQLMKKEMQQKREAVHQPKKPHTMRKDCGKATPAVVAKSSTATARQSHEHADSSPSQPANEDDAGIVATINLKNSGNEQINGLSQQLEFVQTENEILKSELGLAQEQIASLKASLANIKEEDKSIYERIKELEFRESELLKEAHELREQNDLLEFRIVELEESHDKWSLRSQSQSTSHTHTRDVWTDTEKEPDDMMMLSDRSDSGVTSPHSNHQSEDRLSLPSPCDLTMIDNIPSDDIRKRILTMTKRSCYDEEDKICLMQILSLLNNLEALSQDHEISGEFSSLDSCTSRHLQHTPNLSKNRIVATVQPYTESAFYEEPITPHVKNAHRMNTSCNSKVMLWSSLQESGVFEEASTVNQATQTLSEEFPLPSGELTAEIQKLNKFRERIEEVVGHNKSAVKLLSPDQRKLEFYKERAETLENKLLIYESSEDIQLRKLRERLQREVQLESLSKQLQAHIAELEKTNQILEEERCEFEEAENDTRLKYQRLEVDFEMVTQRNLELEMNEEALQTPDVKTTYKKIRMNSYSFPEHVPLSDAAKNLITKILNLDPSRRPSLDEILEHPFLNHGGSIPKLLPVSTIACPPSASYIKQFLPQGNTVKITVQPQRLIDTAPQSQPNSAGLNSNQRNNLISTDKVTVGKDLNMEASKAGQTLGANTMQFNTTSSKDFKLTQKTQANGASNFASTGALSNTKSKPAGRNEIWVKKWVDYSSKYGLGYLLSNGATGVFFNDSTKVILDTKTGKFEYMERRSSDKQDLVSSHTLTDYPKELQKKVTLLQHFKSYLEGDAKDLQASEEDAGQKFANVYVKKWMKTKHAIMFRLSNKIVQVNFTDKTEIILSSENKIVTYVNKKQERSHYPLATALESSNNEMAKRLKYTKEILTHMLNNNHPNGSNPQPQPPIQTEMDGVV